MKNLILACIFIMGQFSALGQLARGRVTNAQSGEPVNGATIRVLRTDAIAVTNQRGEFEIKAFPADSLQVTHTGFNLIKVLAETDSNVLLHPSVQYLNEVIVSGNREEQLRKQIPNAVGKVNSQTIKETKATALYQLLNKVSGVQMVNLGNEQHTMAIRQPVSYNALYLYLEDGLPIRPTGIFNHNALYEINMNGLRNIEVIKGPSSSLYGSNSIGGAINFISLNPSAVDASQISVQGDRFHYYRADLNTGYTGEKAGFAAGAYLARQEKGWQDNSDFDKYSATIKGNYKINAKTRLNIGATYNYLFTQTPGSLDSARFYSRSYTNNQSFSYRKVSAFRTSARVDHDWNKSNSSFLTAFFRDNSTGQLPAYLISQVKNSGQENNQSFHSLGFLLQHRANFKFWNSRLIGGIYLDNSPSSFFAEHLNLLKDTGRNYYTGYANTDSLIDNYRIELFNTASYLQYEFQPVAKLRMVTGVRYDRVSYHFKNSLPASRSKFKSEEKNVFNVLAPKIGATYDFGKGNGIYTNFSTGFQPPETSMLYSSRQLTRLKQATFYSYELGGWLNLLDQKLNLELSFYNMEGRNEIINVLMEDNTTQNQNAASTRHSGIELSVIYQPLQDLSFRCSGTAARHTYLDYSELIMGKTHDYSANRMANAPNFFSNSEVVWKPKQLKGFRTMLEWQFVSRYFINSSNTKTYNGYSVWNIRTGYNFANGPARGLGIWLNSLNLSNRLYASTVTANQFGATYNAAPPRTVNLGLSYSFKKQHAIIH